MIKTDDGGTQYVRNFKIGLGEVQDIIEILETHSTWCGDSVLNEHESNYIKSLAEQLRKQFDEYSE